MPDASKVPLPGGRPRGKTVSWISLTLFGKKEGTVAISLLCWQKLVEERIETAMKEGVFDDLPGKGKPLVLEDDSLVPEELRMAYKVLRNSGHVPPEVADRKEIQDIVEMLETCPDEQTRFRQINKLSVLVRRWNMRRSRPVVLEDDERYYRKVVERVELVTRGDEKSSQEE